MKERPILFSGAMVRALLNGSKTQTRRVVKPKHPPDSHWMVETRGNSHALTHWDNDTAETSLISCPYGQPGERLWVRETWYCDDYRVQRGPYLKPTDMDLDEARDDGTLIYRASSGDRPYEAEQPVWRPAIHMPRWASRITLEITSVRVERLQDISEADALAEGIVECPIPADDEGPRRIGYVVGPDDGKSGLSVTAVEAYRNLWESINGPGSWDANPWVWVVEFRRVGE